MPFGYGGTGRGRFAEAQMLGTESGADQKDTAATIWIKCPVWR